MIELNDIIFGFVDNGIMLLGALTGCSLDTKLENTMDISLALGSFIGCLVPLILYIILKKGIK
jgi:ABC-type uncharacterized transport system permease subunit